MSLKMCFTKIVSKNFFKLYKLVLDGALLFISFKCVSLIVASFFGCVGLRLFCCFVGMGVVTSGLCSELLDGVVWYGFPYFLLLYSNGWKSFP